MILTIPRAGFITIPDLTMNSKSLLLPVLRDLVLSRVVTFAVIRDGEIEWDERSATISDE